MGRKYGISWREFSYVWGKEGVVKKWGAELKQAASGYRKTVRRSIKSQILP